METIQEILKEIQGIYDQLVEEQTNHLDIFFNELADRYELYSSSQSPDKPIIIAVWCDFGKYNLDEFPESFSREINMTRNPYNSAWFKFEDGYACVEVAENASESLIRVLQYAAGCQAASEGWANAVWGIIAYQK